MSSKEICHNNNASESIVHVGTTQYTMLNLIGEKKQLICISLNDAWCPAGHQWDTWFEGGGIRTEAESDAD